MDAFDGSKGESPFANSSEFTNSLHSSISGNSEYEAVVFPAPLHPDMIYKRGILSCHFELVEKSLLFVSHSISEECVVSKTWVVRPDFLECVSYLLRCYDVFLSA